MFILNSIFNIEIFCFLCISHQTCDFKVSCCSMHILFFLQVEWKHLQSWIFLFFLLYKNTVISSSSFSIICDVQKDTVFRHSSRFLYGGVALEVQRQAFTFTTLRFEVASRHSSWLLSWALYDVKLQFLQARASLHPRAHRT